MCQPSWPFEYSVAGVCDSDDFDGDDGEGEGVGPRRGGGRA